MLGHVAKDDHWDTQGIYRCLESLSEVGRKKLFQTVAMKAVKLGLDTEFAEVYVRNSYLSAE